MKKTVRPIFFAALILAGVHVFAQTPRNAAATAVTFNGFVVGVTVNDGGAGYIYPPGVAFNGVGSGAGAYSVVSNGVVTQIVVTNAGSGYATPPAVVISPPSTLLYSFHSGNAYITVPDSASLDSTTGQLTVECWFNQELNPGDWYSVVSKDENDPGFSGYDLRFFNGTAFGSIQTSPQSDLEGGSPTGNFKPTFPAWHHYAMEYDSTTFAVWMDGKKIFSTNFPAQLVLGSNPLTIGRQGSNLRAFYGFIDEVRISKTIRYTVPFNPQIRFTSDSNTIALYHFDEGSGTVAHDSSGNGNNGTIYGNSAWSSNVPSVSPPTVNIHKAVYVDFSNLLIGTNYQIQVATSLYGGTWTNFGSPFVATNQTMNFSNYWNVSDWNQLFFRLSP